MRWFLTVLVLIGAVGGAAWLGGETLLAHKAGQMIAAQTRIRAASVAPMRDWRRIGLNVSDVQLDTPEGRAQFPELTLWASPTRLNDFHLALPDSMTLPIAGQPSEVAADAAELTLRVSPINAMAVTQATATSGPVSMDGARMLGALSAQFQMVPLGHDAPHGARAAYQLTLDVAELDPAPLVATQGATLPGPIGIDGRARLWLSEPIKATPAPDRPGPQIEGASSDGITVTLGDLSARFLGRVTADAQGFASGELYVYTADAPAFLSAAAQAGLIPKGSVMLAGAVLASLGTEPATGGVAVPVATSTALPPPQDGELRLPIVMADGRMTLRGIALGPAPRLR